MRITTRGESAISELLSLNTWLVEEQLAPELMQRPPKSGTLGPIMDEIMIAAGPGGVAVAVASAVVAWLRRRVGDQSLKITRPDGTVFELTVTHVRGLDEVAVRALVTELGSWFESSVPDTDSGEVMPSDEVEL